MRSPVEVWTGMHSSPFCLANLPSFWSISRLQATWQGTGLHTVNALNPFDSKYLFITPQELRLPYPGKYADTASLGVVSKQREPIECTTSWMQHFSFLCLSGYTFNVINKAQYLNGRYVELRRGWKFYLGILMRTITELFLAAICY